MAVKFIPEPFRIKSVEPLKMLSREEREEKIREANYNLFYLRGEDCYIDLLTDSGTNAMSQDQWAGVMRGDEAYAGASSYYKLVEAGKDIFGHGYIQPVHQGRAGEKVLFPLLLGKGKIAISNMFFDTTRAHVELAGARCIDCTVPVARQPAVRAPFKGNMDVARLESLIEEHGAETVSLIVMTITNNSAGGQPVSVQNIRDVAAIAKRYGIPLNIDAARYAENAFFVQRDEPEFKETPIKANIPEMFSYRDTFSMSAKKDGIVNMGGLVGVKDPDSPLVLKVKANCISYEGFFTYGGLSGRDLEALAIGLYEGIDNDYLRYRIGQMEYLASRLDDAGIAYQSPVGGHGVFVDAAAMFPQIPYNQFPGQVLAIELYKEAGIRTCDIGSYIPRNKPHTGEQLRADFEVSRPALPRRGHTQAPTHGRAAPPLPLQRRRAGGKTGHRTARGAPNPRPLQAHRATII